MKQYFQNSLDMLSQFTINQQNPKLKSDFMIDAIKFLIDSKIRLKCDIIPYCFLCLSDELQKQKIKILDCKHVVHYSCLEHKIQQFGKQKSSSEILQCTVLTCLICQQQFQVGDIFQKLISKKMQQQQQQLKLITCNYGQHKVKNQKQLIKLDCPHKSCKECLKKHCYQQKKSSQIYCKLCPIQISSFIIKQNVQEKLNQSINSIIDESDYQGFQKFTPNRIIDDSENYQRKKLSLSPTNRLLDSNNYNPDRYKRNNLQELFMKSIFHSDFSQQNFRSSNNKIWKCKGLLKKENGMKIQMKHKHQQGLQNYMLYFRKQMFNPDYVACDNILTSGDLKSSNRNIVACRVCGIEFCSNGCQTTHGNLSCEQFRKQINLFQDFKKKFNITQQDLDLRGNSNYIKGFVNTIQVGDLYYYPPHGFRQYGINIKRYPRNWLEQQLSSWIYMYYCVENQNLYKNIHATKQMISRQQGYSNKYCIRSGQKIGIGIYGTPHVDVCTMTNKNRFRSSDGIDYHVVIKCKARITALKICPKPSDLKKQDQKYQNDYWVINNPQDIRPYAYLIRKTEKPY